MRQLHLYLIVDRHRAVMEQKMTYHYPVGSQPPSNAEINPQTVSVAQPPSEGQTNFSEVTPDPPLHTCTASCATGYCNLS